MGFLDSIRRELGVAAPPSSGSGDGEDAPEPEHAPAPVPWERLPGEPEPAWLLFSAYLQSAPSISAFASGANATGSSTATIRSLSARWRWLARRAALEAHLAGARAEGMEDAARAQGEQIARVSARLLDQAERAALALELRGGLERMSPKDALAYQAKAIELARLLRGEVTARTGVDLSGLTLEELDQLDAIRKRAAGEPREPEPGGG